MAFRIHPYDEHPRTVLDHDRPMGFYADEVGQDHIRGISGCETLADLASWAELYSAKIRDGDFILYINGEDYSIQTYDRGEVICFPTRYEVIARGRQFRQAMLIASQAWDEDEILEFCAEEGIDPVIESLALKIFDD